MSLCQFPYIKIDILNNSLEENIVAFYINNRKEKTLNHVVSVAKTNINIAEQFNLDVKTCHLSGLLHDISAVMKPTDMLIYANSLNMTVDESEEKYPFLLHQQVSKIFSETLFKVKDVDILSSIECHTTLKSNPSKYNMALFIADKLSWDQEGKPPFYEVVNNALSTSLEAACFEYINYMINHNLILYPHKRLLDAKNYLEIYLAK